MSRNWRLQRVNLAAIAFMVALAAGVAIYVLAHQRVHFPFVGGRRFTVHAEFSTAQAVTPGQGQTVRVSGVRVGDITGVALLPGRALVTMKLDGQYAGLLHTDATAVLRPKTGLKDMFIEMTPGSADAPLLHDGGTLPIARTAPDVDVDQVLKMLDADSRDYLRMLVQGAGQGLQHRGNALAAIYRRFEPTHRDLARVTRSVASRRAELRQLTHELRLVSAAVAAKDRHLAELVDAAAATFGTFASEDHQVSASLRRFPAALRQTTKTLGHVRELADALRPAAVHLVPAADALPAAARTLTPFAREATPELAKEIRPFVRSTAAVMPALTPAVANLKHATPPLTSAGHAINTFLNLLGYNEAGDGHHGVPGYLYWLAWLDHDAIALFSTGDAHGDYRPLVITATCATLQGLAQALGQGDPLTGTALLGLQGVFTDPNVCGTAPQSASFARKLRGAERR